MNAPHETAMRWVVSDTSSVTFRRVDGRFELGIEFRDDVQHDWTDGSWLLLTEDSFRTIVAALAVRAES